MDIIAVCTVGRQFPDKAIDLIDEACATAAKRMMQIGKQEKEVNTVLTASPNAVNEANVGPDEVAQVGILFLLIFVSIVQSMLCDCRPMLCFEGCEPMYWNSCCHT
jgi:hypothetical protein